MPNKPLLMLLLAVFPGLLPAQPAAEMPGCNCRDPEATFIRSQMPGTYPYFQGTHHFKKGFIKTAVEEWQAAAKWGDKRSQQLVGLMYLEGKGVEKDWAQAHAWLTLAASRGRPSAVSDKNRLWGAMTAQEKAQAVARFESLTETYGDDVVSERLFTWYRREFRGPTPNVVYSPGNAGVPVINFREKLEETLMGEAFPDYDVLYRDFRILESAENSTEAPESP